MLLFNQISLILLVTVCLLTVFATKIIFTVNLSFFLLFSPSIFSPRFDCFVFFLCVNALCISKGSKQNYFQALETSSRNWSSNFFVDFCFYRTNSHFGYRIPTQMWIPKQFHFPDPSPEPITALPTCRLVRTPSWMEFCSESMSNYSSNETARHGHNFQDDMPTIKCSLCKSSTPTKQTANPNESDDSDNAIYESIMSDMSNISSLPSDATIWPATVQAHGDHCSNRFVVRIFTR